VAAAACVAVLALGAHRLLPAGQRPDTVLSSVLSAVLPPALLPLAWLAFLAAMMSSADSVLLTGATVLDVDLLGGCGAARRGAAPRAVVGWLAAAGTATALLAGGIVPLLMWAYTVFAAGAPVPILAALLLRRRMSGGWAVAALVLGGTAAAAARLAGWESAVLAGLAVSAATAGAGLAAEGMSRRS
jgi:SSS family solute:Na+ symporter